MKARPNKLLANFGLRAVPTKDARGVRLATTPHKTTRGLGNTGTMTAADWDKFERDIAEVFERVP